MYLLGFCTNTMLLLTLADSLTYRQSPKLTSNEGKQMQRAMWDETIEVLAGHVPKVRSAVENISANSPRSDR